MAYHSYRETPEQNSVVERKHQHLLNVAKALMFQSQVLLSYWGDCVLTAVFLINKTPSQLLHNKTPYELLTGTAPDYSQIQTFGCLSYVYTSPKQRHKFEARSKACVFLGYPSGYKGYKLLDLETNNIFISRIVVFFEDVFPFAKAGPSQVYSDFFTSLESLPLAYPPIAHSIPPSTVVSPSIPSSDSLYLLPLPSHRPKKPHAHLQDYHCYTLDYDISHPVSSFLSYSNLSPSYLSFINSITKFLIPTTFAEAKDSKEWCDAVDKEIGAMEYIDTWAITTLPPGKISVGCGWIFT